MSDSSDTSAGDYQPSPFDVIAVKTMFLKRYSLPNELLDAIIDFAEYWPHTTSKMASETSVRSGSDHENKMLLRSYPLGFIPSNDDRDPGQMLSQYQKNFAVNKPEAWPPARKVPDDATDEVFKTWVTKSLPRSNHPCRKIVFKIKSHDQGWGGEHGNRGTYNGSYTWFEVGLEKVSACRETNLLEAWELAPFPQFRLIGDLHDSKRNPTVSNSRLVCSLHTIVPSTKSLPEEPDEDELASPKYNFQFSLGPTEMALQRNVTATRSTKEHIIVWSDKDDISNPESAEAVALEKVGRGRATGSGEFVRNLKIGDVVTVWGKSRFAGWTNTVEEVQIDVYWSV